MADSTITGLAAAASVAGTEEIAVNKAGVDNKVTPAQIWAYIKAQIEGSSSLADPGSDDSFLMLENDGTLKESTYEVIEDAIAETMYAEADYGAIGDTDEFLAKDNATTKGKVVATAIAAYTLSKNEDLILDVTGKTANGTPADANKICTIDGSTPKVTTWAELRASVLGGFDTYMNALAAVSSTNDSDVVYCTQSGTEKKMTLLQIVNHINYPINGSGAAGYLADWSDSDTLTNTYAIVTSFVAGTNLEVPTSKAVADGFDGIINDANAMGAAIVNSDTFLMDDGAGGTQVKATFTQLKTWLEGEYAYIAGMDQAVDTTATPEFAGMTITNATNIALATGTGTKIGTGATQKLGFWNATPVVQQAHIADPAAASAVTASAAGSGADGTTWNGAECGAAKTDLDNVKTNLDELNTKMDSILAVQAATGITASS